MIRNTINPKLKAQSFKARFLEKGVVKYEDEMVLIKPDNLMNIANDFKGAHVIIDHQNINLNNANEIVGYITNVWYNEEDGWAWCDFTVNNEEAINLINKGYSVSCAYIPEFAQGGTYHNIPYDQEIIGCEALHLAIVENPRYEDAIILQNSIKNKIMTIFKFKKDKVENKVEVKEIDLESAMFEIEEGKNVSISDMVTIYKNAKNAEEEEKKKEEAKVNAEDEFEIDGKMVKVSELAACYKAAKKKNAEDEKKEDESSEDEKKENESSEDEKKEEPKNAKKNSLESIKMEKAKFENGIENPLPRKIILDKDRFALGASVYGAPQKITK